MEFNTALLHKGFNGEKVFGSTLTPIYQVSAFSHSSAEQLEKVFNNRAPGYAYSRIGNPTVTSFENRIASIENGVGAVACSSGMAAVTMALLNILESGDEVIASAGLFGGTIDLFGDLEPFGIVTRYVNKVTAEEIEPLINEKTKAVFAELIGNPGLEIADLDAVSELVHSHGVPLIIDSTTATPYLIQPFEHGADIVVHSSSKYINGGGNSISGIIVDSGNFEWNTERYKGLAEYKKFGRLAYVAKLRNGIWRNIGCCLAPFNAFMNSVGLETLGLRMERLCYNALELAKFFETQNGIEVNYPALEASPYYSKYTIAKDAYGLDADATTVAVGAVVVARDDVDENDIYNVVAGIYDSIDTLGHDKKNELDLDFAASVTAVPYHKGAAKYFAEKGLTVPTK